MKKVLRNTLAITLMLLTMGFAVGCSNATPQKSETPEGRQGMRVRQWDPEEIKTALAGLVKDSTISQQQADAVATYLDKQAQERKNMGGRGLNQGERPNPGERPNTGERLNQGKRPSPLGELVSNGTITQDQADKIAEVMFQPRSMNKLNN